MDYGKKEKWTFVLMVIGFTLLLLDVFGVIDFHIPGWIIKQLGAIL